MTELAHHGVKGMHWGVRKSQNGSGSTKVSKSTLKTPKHVAMKAVHDRRHAKAVAAVEKTKQHSPDAKVYKQLQEKVNRGSVHSLSNEELRKLNTRLNLEQQYSRMVSEQKKKNRSRTHKIAATVVAGVGGIAVNQVKQELGRKGAGFVINQVKKP